eukprot:g16105.t1
MGGGDRKLAPACALPAKKQVSRLPCIGVANAFAKFLIWGAKICCGGRDREAPDVRREPVSVRSAATHPALEAAGRPGAAAAGSTGARVFISGRCCDALLDGGPPEKVASFLRGPRDTSAAAKQLPPPCRSRAGARKLQGSRSRGPSGQKTTCVYRGVTPCGFSVAIQLIGFFTIDETFTAPPNEAAPTFPPTCGVTAIAAPRAAAFACAFAVVFTCGVDGAAPRCSGAKLNPGSRGVITVRRAVIVNCEYTALQSHR